MLVDCGQALIYSKTYYKIPKNAGWHFMDDREFKMRIKNLFKRKTVAPRQVPLSLLRELVTYHVPKHRAQIIWFLNAHEVGRITDLDPSDYMATYKFLIKLKP